ncbi:hypothetical protein [Pandoraea apista]|uniref:hypothetical protein n=1 Tax=Pandoraea apista TaxID=93218 RepID=UPI0012E27585|nr:hypothetical protein [Pandoraea apista]
MVFLLGSSDCGSILGMRVKKKPPDSLAVFQDSFRCLLLQLPLSFRQRCEIRKKVKIKLIGGHEGCHRYCIAGVRRAQKPLYTPNRMTLQPCETAEWRENARKQCIFSFCFALKIRGFGNSCENARFAPGVLLCFTHFFAVRHPTCDARRCRLPTIA